MTTFTQLNETLLMDYFDNLGAEIVQQMIDLYCEQVQIYLQDIDDAINSTEQGVWRECCHKMKGAAGSVGFETVHKALVLMEKNTESSDEKRKMLTGLKKLNTAALKEFNTWLAFNLK